MFGRVQFRFYALVILALILAACGAPNPTDKAGILDQVNIDLSNGDCSDALNLLLPFYNSVNSDNDVRMAMAEVYACEGGYNFFGFFNKLQNVKLGLGTLFETFAQEFPSQNLLSDKTVESAGFGMDALMASLQSGIVLIPGDLFNTTTNNPGSLLWTDRTSDSNLYLYFMSMVAMGGLENRVNNQIVAAGTPLANPPLPWITSSTAPSTVNGGTNGGMQAAPGYTTSGCEYASALVNFADASAAISTQCLTQGQTGYPAVTNIPGQITNQLNCLANTAIPGESFAQLIYDACNFGCQGLAPTVANGFTAVQQAGFDTTGNWANNACGGSSFCQQCPLLLRNRGNCAGTANDAVSCAAAGVINFVNNSGLRWQ